MPVAGTSTIDRSSLGATAASPAFWLASAMCLSLGGGNAKRFVWRAHSSQLAPSRLLLRLVIGTGRAEPSFIYEDPDHDFLVSRLQPRLGTTVPLPISRAAPIAPGSPALSPHGISARGDSDGYPRSGLDI